MSTHRVRTAFLYLDEGRSDKSIIPCAKKAAKFEYHTNDSVGETLAQCRMIARICALFKAYVGEQTWTPTYRGQVKRTMLLSREDDQDHKIRARKQRTGAGKYSFVNRTIKLWYQLHAEALVTSKHEIEKCTLYNGEQHTLIG